MRRKLERCQRCSRILPLQEHHVARRRNSSTFTTNICDECHRISGIHQYEGDPLLAILFGSLQSLELLYQRTDSQDIQEALNSVETVAKQYLGYDSTRRNRSSRKRVKPIREEQRELDLHDSSILYRDLLRELKAHYSDGLDFLSITLLIKFYDTCAMYPARYLEWCRLRPKNERPEMEERFARAFKLEAEAFIADTGLANEVIEIILSDAVGFLKWNRQYFQARELVTRQ